MVFFTVPRGSRPLQYLLWTVLLIASILAASYYYTFTYMSYFSGLSSSSDFAISPNGQYMAVIATTSTYGFGYFISSNGGTSWTKTAFTSGNYAAVDPTGTYYLCAISGSNAYGIYLSSDAGKSFQQVYYINGYTNIYYQVAISPGSGQYMAAALGSSGVLISYNYGVTWYRYIPVSNAGYVYVTVAISSDGNTLYAGSYNCLAKSTNGGSIWTNMISKSVSSLAISSNGNVVIFPVSTTQLYYSTDGAKSFTTITVNFPYSTGGGISNLGCDSTGTVIYLTSGSGTTAGYFISTNSGTSWSTLFKPGSSIGIAANSYDASTLLVGVTGSSIYRATNSYAPTVSPTTIMPSRRPTFKPTASPTARPTRYPTSQPTSSPSAPTSQPTSSPTSQPSNQPSSHPTNPTSKPSSQPTRQPFSRPTSQPSKQPYAHPSAVPSCQPTSAPTNPTGQPTSQPSRSPTASPTTIPICPAGSYYEFTEFGYECLLCPVGTYSLVQSRTCTPCPVGTYAATNGSASCLGCPLNTYQPDSGATFCNTCPNSFVTGQTGSDSKAQCVYPASNFIIGGLSLAFSIFMIYTYLHRGRLLRVAFQRRYFLIRKSIILFGGSGRMTDLVNASSNLISKILRTSKTETRWKQIAKQVAFVFLAFILVPIIIMIVITYYIVHILFNSMVLWRAYRLYIHLPSSFYEEMSRLLDIVSITLNLRFVEYLAYPFVVITNFFANLNINLSTVQVTCSGSQAPVYLLINVLIVGLVIIIIKSDVQVFWITAVSKVLNKTHNLVFSRFYFSRNKSTALWYATWATVFSILPEPKKVIQYALGYISFTMFFTNNGHAESNANCDSAESIPIDSILGIFTTIFTVLMILPVTYILAQVIVPCFRKHYLFSSLSGGIQGNELSSSRPTSSRPNSTSSKTNSIKSGHSVDRSINDDDDQNVVLIKTQPSQIRHYLSTFIRVISVFTSLDWFYIKGICAFGESLFQSHRKFLLKSYETIQKHEATTATTTRTSESSNPSKHRHDLLRLWGMMTEAECSELPHLPWLKSINELSKDDDIQYERQLEKKLWNEYVQEYPSYRSLVMQARGDYDREFQKESYKINSPTASKALATVFSFLPLFSYEVMYVWARVARNYFIVVLISIGYWPTFVSQDFDLIYGFESLLKTLEKVRTESMNEFTRRSTIQMTLGEAMKGLQDDEDAEDILKASQKIPELFTTNATIDEETQAKVERLQKTKQTHRIVEELTSKETSSFSEVANDPKLFFMQYVSAIVSVRVVLLQLFPILTLWSVIAVELSENPIFIMSKDMEEYLPPLIVMHPREAALEYLRLDFNNSKSSKNKRGQQPPWWKVYVLSAYIFFTKSRLIQFIFKVYMAIISAGLLFRIERFQSLVVFLVVMLIVIGLIFALYMMLFLHKFLFPADGDDDENEEAEEEDQPSQSKKKKADDEDKGEANGGSSDKKEMVANPILMPKKSIDQPTVELQSIATTTAHSDKV